MASSDFICAICKQVRSANWLTGMGKYKCPTHKFICGDHVSGLLIRKCLACDSKVLTYSFRGKKWKKV